MLDDYILVHAKVPFGLRTLFGMEALWVGLAYDTRDPYAIHFTPRRGTQSPRWMFSRDLLDQGLFTETGAGEGDVRLRPGADSATVVVELNSPDGFAALETSTAELVTFLERTYTAIPPGEEHHWIDFERELAMLG